jgi:hypothetical protein
VNSAKFACRGFSELRQRRFKEHPFGACIAPRAFVALGAAAPYRSGRNGVQEMHLLQIEHPISVEQVAQTVMEEHV